MKSVAITALAASAVSAVVFQPPQGSFKSEAAGDPQCKSGHASLIVSSGVHAEYSKDGAAAGTSRASGLFADEKTYLSDYKKFLYQDPMDALKVQADVEGAGITAADILSRVKQPIEVCCPAYCGKCDSYEGCENVRAQDSRYACCAKFVAYKACENNPDDPYCIGSCETKSAPCSLGVRGTEVEGYGDLDTSATSDFGKVKSDCTGVDASGAVDPNAGAIKDYKNDMKSAFTGAHAAHVAGKNTGADSDTGSEQWDNLKKRAATYAATNDHRDYGAGSDHTKDGMVAPAITMAGEHTTPK